MSVSNLPESIPEESGISLSSSNGNMKILFITLALIVGVLIFWIIISNTGRSPPLDVINGILTNTIKPVTDAVVVEPSLVQP